MNKKMTLLNVGWLKAIKILATYIYVTRPTIQQEVLYYKTHFSLVLHIQGFNILDSSHCAHERMYFFISIDL